jgi:hypothetical protein
LDTGQDLTRSVRARQRLWPPSLAESTFHAWLLAGLLIVLVGWTAATQWPLLVSGWGKRDFLYFYTIGRVALEGRADLMYDHRALHEFQVALIPRWPDWFYSVYPPQTAILFASVAWLPYGWALIAWTLSTAAAYGLVAWLASPPGPRALLIAGLIDVIPFWTALLAGQSTLWPLLAFGLGGHAYIQGRKLMAGLAFGLLFVKPQLGLVLAVVLVACGEWTIIAGIALSAAAQFIAPMVVFGWDIWPAYARFLESLPSLKASLESWGNIQHGLAALTRPLPGWLQGPVWMTLSLPVIYAAWRTWRGDSPAPIKMAVLVVSSVIVCPHVLLYDCTLLVLPVLWAAHASSREQLAGPVYLLVLTFAIPFAFLFGLQLSLAAVLWFLYVLTRPTRAPSHVVSTP